MYNFMSQTCSLSKKIQNSLRVFACVTVMQAVNMYPETKHQSQSAQWNHNEYYVCVNSNTIHYYGKINEINVRVCLLDTQLKRLSN